MSRKGGEKIIECITVLERLCPKRNTLIRNEQMMTKKIPKASEKLPIYLFFSNIELILNHGEKHCMFS